MGISSTRLIVAFFRCRDCPEKELFTFSSSFERGLKREALQ
jgi:hypothetical protein